MSSRDLSLLRRALRRAHDRLKRSWHSIHLDFEPCYIYHRLLVIHHKHHLLENFPLVNIWKGLNGVNRQPSNGQKINRQPSKTEYFYRQQSNERAKINRQISFLIFLKIFLNNFFKFTANLSPLLCEPTVLSIHLK